MKDQSKIEEIHKGLGYDTNLVPLGKGVEMMMEAGQIKELGTVRYSLSRLVGNNRSRDIDKRLGFETSRPSLRLFRNRRGYLRHPSWGYPRPDSAK